MSSIWNNAVSPAGNSSFAATAGAPKPGGGAAARFQSLISPAASSQRSRQPSAQLGLSPGTTAAPGVNAGSTGAAKPATGGSKTSASSSSSAAITSNDFLTLLVTEMQNQDPTAQTDPNAYVDQLVQINSLEQLISMNQNLALVLGTVTSPVPTGGAAAGSGSAASVGAVSSTSSSSASSSVSGGPAALSRSSIHGNLSAASHVVAHALDGHPVGALRGHAMRDIPTH